MKKNTAPFVCGLLGAIFGLIGGILWSACSATLADAQASLNAGSSMVPYVACFVIFGIGGGVISFVGSIMAFGWKKAGFPLLLVGTLFQVATIVAAFVLLRGASGLGFALSIFSIIAVILLVVATILAIVKKNPNNQQTTTTDAE